jgi:outer membrane protein
VLDKQKELEILNSEVTKAGYMPSLTAKANYSYQGLGNRGAEWNWFDASTIGLSLNIPIFDGFYKRSKVQQSQIKVQKIDLDKQNMKEQFQMEYQNAVNKLNNRRSVVKKQEANMNLAEDVYKTTQEQYQNGVSSMTDLLNDDNALKDAQTAYLQSLIQIKVAELEYMKTNGSLGKIAE